VIELNRQTPNSNGTNSTQRAFLNLHSLQTSRVKTFLCEVCLPLKLKVDCNSVENVDALETLSLATLSKRLVAVRGVVENINDEQLKTNGEKSIEEEESFVPIYTPEPSPRPNDNNDDDDTSLPHTPDTQPSPRFTKTKTISTLFKKPVFISSVNVLKRLRDDDESSLEEGEYSEESKKVDFSDDDDDEKDEDYVSKKEIRKQLKKKAKTVTSIFKKTKTNVSASASDDDDEIEIIAVNGVKVKK